MHEPRTLLSPDVRAISCTGTRGCTCTATEGCTCIHTARVSVLMPNCEVSARVRAHPLVRDARGRAVPTADDPVTERGPYPANAVEQQDKSWRLRLDPRLWPLEAGDELTDGTRVWAVVDARITEVPGASDVDSVVCTGTLEPPAHL